MNEILKTIHWRAFFITFVTTILLSKYYASIYYAYVFIENSASISALTFFGLLSIIAFIKLVNNTFISAIIWGHIIITPFVAGVGWYDIWQPSLTAKYVSTMWDLSPYSVEYNFITKDRDFNCCTSSNTSVSVLGNIFNSLQSTILYMIHIGPCKY